VLLPTSFFFIKSPDFSGSSKSLGFSGFFRLSGLYLIHQAYLHNLIFWTAGRPSLKIWLSDPSEPPDCLDSLIISRRLNPPYSEFWTIVTFWYHCLNLEILEAFPALEAFQTLQPFRAFPVFQANSILWTIFPIINYYWFLSPFLNVCPSYHVFQVICYLNLLYDNLYLMCCS